MRALFNPVPFAPSTLTDGELLRIIDHHYPNLQGPLRELVVRVTRNTALAPQSPPVPAPAQSCPHCGSEFILRSDE
jgi:hypothetical protein